MCTSKELMKLCKDARYPDKCNILARWIVSQDIIQKLEAEGYRRLSLRLSEAVRMPTHPQSVRWMERILSHI